MDTTANGAKDFVIPPQPQIVIAICEMLNNPGTSIQQISNVLSKDASLSAQLLKTVNSSYFYRRQKISSIHSALTSIGLSAFRIIVLKNALRQIYSTTNFLQFERFWRHSELSAAGCSLVASRFAPDLSETAYIAGLFHDCAVPILAARQWRLLDLG